MSQKMGKSTFHPLVSRKLTLKSMEHVEATAFAVVVAWDMFFQVLSLCLTIALSFSVSVVLEEILFLEAEGASGRFLGLIHPSLGEFNFTDMTCGLYLSDEHQLEVVVHLA